MQNNNKKFRVILIIVSIVFAIIAGIALRDDDKDSDLKLTYAETINAVQNGKVETILTFKDSHTFKIFLKEESDEGSSPNHMYIMIAPNIDEFTSFIADEIKKGNAVEFEVEEESSIVTSLVSLCCSILPLLLVIYFMNRMMNGSGTKIKPIRSNVRFDDVAGIDEEKKQVQEIVEFLKHPERYESIGAKIPKGVLLNGEPGTGKTLLAKAIAGEAGVPFFQVNGSSFEEKFVGVGASRVRKLFSEAKHMAPAIIFIDELDSVAQKRYGSKANYSEQTLNQLLSEMDGFDTQDNVIVIAATNHIEVLDEAITRPGRFDRTVYIPKPDLYAREAILEVHARNKNFAEDVSLQEVARKTTGFCGADLENILNEAAIYAVNHGRYAICASDIDEAIARVIAGLKKENAAISDYDKWLTAVHEAGHAVVSRIVRPNVDNFTISIVPRGQAGGYNFFDDSDGVYLQKKEMLLRLQVMYAGRIAEEMILNDISSGARNDLENASKLVHMMITKLAMHDKLLTQIPGEHDLNAEIQRMRVNDEEEVCRENYDAAKAIVTEHLELIKELAQTLLECETLRYEEINHFFEDHGIK